VILMGSLGMLMIYTIVLFTMGFSAEITLLVAAGLCAMAATLVRRTRTGGPLSSGGLPATVIRAIAAAVTAPPATASPEPGPPAGDLEPSVPASTSDGQ
jgi:hypothetical protein